MSTPDIARLAGDANIVLRRVFVVPPEVTIEKWDRVSDDEPATGTYIAFDRHTFEVYPVWEERTSLGFKGGGLVDHGTHPVITWRLLIASPMPTQHDGPPPDVQEMVAGSFDEALSEVVRLWAMDQYRRASE